MTICAIDSLMFLSSTPALLYCVLYCWGLKSTNHISQLPLPAGCLLESATGNLKLLLENHKGQAERFSLWAPTVWQSLVVGTGKAERILTPEAWTKAPSFFLVPILVKTRFWPTISWPRTTWNSFSNSTAAGAIMAFNSGTFEASYP